jgi:flagellar L-ring protein precursor FlgH
MSANKPIHSNRAYILSLHIGLAMAMAILFVFITGCTSVGKQWRSMIGANEPEKATPRTRATGATYSQQNNLPPSAYRKYNRTKRKDFEDAAHLESKSGSLWVMEGQGAYLFSQNVVRMIGDPLAIRLEGDPAEQLKAKSGVISKLLAQLEERRRRAMGREPAADGKKGEAKPGEAAPAAPGAAPGAPGAAAAPAPVAASPAPGAPEEEKEFGVKTVPTRVVERLVDGNYRVRGTQPFVIGQREYKVIVTGIVRAEDFNEQGISASQLLDSNFDIVSSKSTEMR